MQEIASGTAHLPLTIENVYFVGQSGQPWVLIDTGTPGMALTIQAAAKGRYGENARPEAILLTHGHTDHAGSAGALAEIWNVPIYVHPLELPYLTGQSKYPPKDPTVGGAMAFISRAFPMNVVNLSGLIQPLPADGFVPGLPHWEWHFTPGHSPGHVSYFRAEDALLLAGDAFTTVNLDSFADLVTKNPQISLPPTPFTCDWEAARRSVALLTALNPKTIGCGHGRPLNGPSLPADLRRFSETFTPPAHGRYVGSPAVTDANGVISVPPPAPDLFPVQAAALAAVFAGAYALSKNRETS
jgi:glyoxylase-like metal-dependent hydrolase (beta-lactamase superfamily II)